MAGNTYVFGYGSLIEKASRTRTNPDAIEAWPARVTGYQRGWFHQFSNNVGSTCTFLGAIESAGATINGVVYRVGDIEKTKERETGYTATRVDGKITMLYGSGPLNPADEVYLFVSNPEDISKTKESYVDICINGCLEIEALYPSAAGFTQEFIKTSTGWNKYWVNDRLYPRRPFIYCPNSSVIDRALETGGVLQYVQLNDLG